jgi:MoxR-like ATPase
MPRIDLKTTYRIAFDDGRPTAFHKFDELDRDAIEAAEAAQRPLLVRGEPGIGKSQLALAAAVATGRAFVQQVVNIRTDPQDLLWQDDPVARLADAQLIGALADAKDAANRREQLRADLGDRTRYYAPGVFWWAFQWSQAAQQAARSGAKAPPQLPECHAANGVVLLIDEIDKAETDLPNGLLEVLGARQFQPDFVKAPIVAQKWPLVVITTNEERELPAAFLRRCVVRTMSLPAERDRLIDHLIMRGRTTFSEGMASDRVLREAAGMLADDRSKAEASSHRFKPGQAEYLDLLRALVTLAPKDEAEQLQRLRQVHQFFLQKNPPAVS